MMRLSIGVGFGSNIGSSLLCRIVGQVKIKVDVFFERIFRSSGFSIGIVYAPREQPALSLVDYGAVYHHERGILSQGIAEN